MKNMKITLICVGKIKEKHIKDGILEYLKRLKRFTEFEIIEVADEKAPEKLSIQEEEIVKKKEAEKMIKRIKDNTYLIVLDVLGKKISSDKFAKKISDICIGGKSKITFVIGGSLGIHKDLLNMADFRFSMSDLTFPHQLIRFFLLEQIYRGFKIINNETYHK